MNLEEIKSKLSKKKSLAMCFNIGGAAAGVAAGVAAGLGSNLAITAARVAEKGEKVKEFQEGLIAAYSGVYIDPYVKIDHNPETFLADLQANKELIPEYDYLYDIFNRGFASFYDKYINPDEILAQSMGIGVGTAVLAWALISAIPTAKYLKCRKKYKELVKQNGELKEEEMSL